MNSHAHKGSRGTGRALSRAGAAALLVLGLWLTAGGAAAGPQSGKNHPVAVLVKNLEVGRPVRHENLTIVPVYLSEIRNRSGFTTLDEAVKNGWIEITELDGGSVPRVRISNLSKNIIYLMGGEILSGAKQDRILASDILLGPGTKNLIAPVFCVEAGRWAATTNRFTSKSNLGTFDLRSKAQEKGEGAQGEIWSRVAAQNAKVGVASPTNAYQDAYESEQNKVRIQKIEERMSTIPRLFNDTIGVVIGLGDKIVSVDLFLNPELFQKQWPKLLRSSALASLGRDGRTSLNSRAAADFLRSFLDKEFITRKALDWGQESSSADDQANIQALIYNGGVIHLAAFPQDRGRFKVIESQGPEQRPRVIRDQGMPDRGFRPEAGGIIRNH